MKRSTFDKGMALLGEAFSTDPSPERIRIYWRIFEHDLTDAEWEAAVSTWLVEGKFFPVPANLLTRKPKVQSLMIPGRWSCSMCGNQLSFPVSRERGYCGKCWREMGGDVEDNRNEQDVLDYAQRLRGRGPEQIGEIEWGLDDEGS